MTIFTSPETLPAHHAEHPEAEASTCHPGRDAPSPVPVLHTRPQTAFALVWLNPFVRAAALLLLAACGLWLLLALSHVLLLATIAYTLAHLAQPLLRALNARQLPRQLPRLPGALLLVVLTALLLLLIAALTLSAARQVSAAADTLPTAAQGALDWAAQQARRHPTLLGPLHTLDVRTGHGTQLAQRYLLPLLKSRQGPLLSGAFSLLGGLLESVAILILSVYMALDYGKINQTLLRLFPRPWQGTALNISGNVRQMLGGYLKGRLVIAALIGVFVGVGLSLAGIPGGAGLGLLAGLLSVAPYLGVITVVPALLLAAALPAALLKVSLVMLIFVAASQVEGNLLAPLVLAQTTDLRPATVTLSVLCGLALYGLPGALVAVPLAALGKLLLAEYYFKSRAYQTGP